MRRVHSLKARLHHCGHAVTTGDPLAFEGGHLGPRLELNAVLAARRDPSGGGSRVRAQRTTGLAPKPASGRETMPCSAIAANTS